MTSHAKRRITAGLAVGLLAAASPALAVDLDSDVFTGLRARSIGPAVMSGRIMAIDAVSTDPLTVWVGAASGGVWRSKDGGLTFTPVFDDHPQSIGAIRIDPSDPERVWVGTGESCTRNSVSVGKGVYRTTDGGDSWTLVGLEDAERIADILVHPEDGDVVWVCATGHLWDANETRGVFKTTDGGTTWEKVLYVDENTGCSDLAIDPQEPDVLYAGMWQFRRYPDFFESGGPGSGLYKSTDGGKTWAELTRGLPEGEKGRIAVAVAPSRASRVYALVESEDTALYRSDDLGGTWEQVNDSFAVSARPFYFGHLLVDPANHDRVYKPGYYLALSTDGGKSFSSVMSGAFGGSVHPDHHALWINPANPQELLLGTDGGVYMSYNGSTTFRHVRSLPVSQFYEVSYDTEWPYNVYGGLQDNGSWMGPSRSVGGIENADWRSVGYGDGFHTYRDPYDPDLVYAEYQGGNLLRHRLSTGETQEIRPLPGKDDPEFRFNWNTALHVSPNTEGTLYYGAQFLFRSRDRGDHWEKISPDLTTNAPERQRQKESGGLSTDNTTAENNATIFTISESPRDGNVLWVGTDDGRVQVTRDGGASWSDVTPPGVPAGTWVSHVEASPHDASTAHLSFDGHRGGDMATYAFRTTDLGETWSSVVGEGLEGFVHVVVQDPVRADLLYAGTEFGLYLTVDGGERWARFASGVPMVPVHDIDVHPTEHDLIVGTHGRGIYILDDLTPLRALDQATIEKSVALLPARDAVMVLNASSFGFAGQDEFVGRNPPESATIFYYQSRRHIFGDLFVEILDEDGEVLATLPGGKVKGINRVEWPMRFPAPKLPPATNLAPAFVGPRVPEGEYRFRLVKGKETLEGTVRLVPDPRSPHSPEDRRLQQETGLELYDMLGRLTYVVDATIDLRDQAKQRRSAAGKSKLADRLKELEDDLESFRASLVSTSEAGLFSGDEKFREKLAAVYSGVTGYDGRPTGSQLDRTKTLGEELRRHEATFAEKTSAERLESINRSLAKDEADPLVLLSRDAWEDRQDGGGGASGTSTIRKPREIVALVGEALGLF